MSERSTPAHARPLSTPSSGDVPPPEVVDFIRFCHARRGVGWPEIYDEMCAVAARREFRGWDHEDLAAHGLAFSLFEMPRLAGWVRTVLAASPEAAEPQPRLKANPLPA